MWLQKTLHAAQARMNQLAKHTSGERNHHQQQQKRTRRKILESFFHHQIHSVKWDLNVCCGVSVSVSVEDDNDGEY